VPREEVKARIETTWRAYFHGDGQEQRLYFETGANANGTLAYVTDWANNDARSEGMSYGMMIAVQLGHKREFDAVELGEDLHAGDRPGQSLLWLFRVVDGHRRQRAQHRAAPDGEEFFAMALYFAANRWGNGTGIYDYKAEADRILTAMRHRAVMTGTPPFRIHPEDAPFVQPDHPWPSINNRAEAAALAAQGKTARRGAIPRPSPMRWGR
jgi:oligosaccharide reducing-end xylanase